MRMPTHWRLLLVVPMLSSVAPVSAERLANAQRHSSECPYARARAEAASMNAVPFLGLKRRSASALMP
jgi:hypothetical protein